MTIFNNEKVTNMERQYQVIVSINGRIDILGMLDGTTSGYDIYNLIMSRYGIAPEYCYITDMRTHKRIPRDSSYYPFIISLDDGNDVGPDRFIDVRFRLKGGGIMKKILKWIFKIIFAVFDPIIKPLRAIANGFLMLIKAIIYMIALTIWIFKVMVWFFVQFLPSLPFDLILLVKQLIMLIVSTVIQTASQLVGRVVNWFGRQTIYSISTGWDNARDSDTLTTNTSGTIDPRACQQHCYRTASGAIPFSIVVVTVLCPPVGVFMEYGLVGWLKILVCFLLTLMLYFPGLIYALILLYC